MTPWDRLLAVDWANIQSARAGDLMRVFEECDLTHLLVVEFDKKSATASVRALASRTRLMRQLTGLRRTA